MSTTKKRKQKTKKEIKSKLDFFEQALKEVENKMGQSGLLPNQLNKLYDLKLQFISGIGVLNWVLGETE